jgi:hypothetical protein
MKALAEKTRRICHEKLLKIDKQTLTELPILSTQSPGDATNKPTLNPQFIRKILHDLLLLLLLFSRL